MFYNTCKVRPPHTVQYIESENRYLPLHTHVSSPRISIWALTWEITVEGLTIAGRWRRETVTKNGPSLQRHFLFINQKFWKFWNSTFPGKFSENLEIVEFLKSEPFNWKFQKVWEEINWKGNFCLPHKFVLFSRNFEIAVPFVTRNFWKFKPEFSSNRKCPRLPV